MELFNARILLANNEIQKLEESINDSKEGWVNIATNYIKCFLFQSSGQDLDNYLLLMVMKNMLHAWAVLLSWNR